MKPLILSICDHTGNWSRPYAEAGYHVVTVDLANAVRRDVRLNEWIDEPVYGILAAPPCTAFSKAGAWTWEAKGEAAILDGLSIVDACLRAVAIYRPVFWALENPAGRLRRWIGPPKWSFDPCQFGGAADDPDSEAYTKKTYLWGHFTPPTPLFSAAARRPVEPRLYGVEGGNRDRTTHLGSRKQVERSATPTGFARAFFEVNQ